LTNVLNMNFSFIQITDHHLTAADAELVHGYSTRATFRAVLQHIAQHAAGLADFIISTGDIVDNPTETAYRSFLQMVNAQNASVEMPGPLLISAEGLHKFPLYLLPGNHDDRSNFFTCLFPKSSPAPLMNVAFTHKGVQFICLDLGPDTKTTLHLETLNFLARSLETDAPSIILMHHQLVSIGSRWLDTFMADDLKPFWDVVAGRNALGILCGHLHMTYERVVNAIPIFGLRSTSFSFALQDEPLLCLLPPHYRLVTVQDGKLTTQIFEVPL
jgi:3',5'-cyclic-AMP phosphodiesterase